jgi:glucans biosynthesis protein
VRTGVGARGEGSKIFVLDLVGDRFKSIDPNIVRGNVSAEKAEIRNVVSQPNAAIGGWRLSFEVSVKDKSPIELRASLAQGSDAISEVWVYRWAP